MQDHRYLVYTVQFGKISPELWFGRMTDPKGKSALDTLYPDSHVVKFYKLTEKDCKLHDEDKNIRSVFERLVAKYPAPELPTDEKNKPANTNESPKSV